MGAPFSMLAHLRSACDPQWCAMLETNLLWWISLVSVVPRGLWPRVDFIEMRHFSQLTERRDELFQKLSFSTANLQWEETHLGWEMPWYHTQGSFKFLPHLWVDWVGCPIFRTPDFPLAHFSPCFLYIILGKMFCFFAVLPPCMFSSLPIWTWGEAEVCFSLSELPQAVAQTNSSSEPLWLHCLPQEKMVWSCGIKILVNSTHSLHLECFSLLSLMLKNLN